MFFLIKVFFLIISFFLLSWLIKNIFHIEKYITKKTFQYSILFSFLFFIFIGIPIYYAFLSNGDILIWYKNFFGAFLNKFSNIDISVNIYNSISSDPYRYLKVAIGEELLKFLVGLILFLAYLCSKKYKKNIIIPQDIRNGKIFLIFLLISFFSFSFIELINYVINKELNNILSIFLYFLNRVFVVVFLSHIILGVLSYMISNIISNFIIKRKNRKKLLIKYILMSILGLFLSIIFHYIYNSFFNEDDLKVVILVLMYYIPIPMYFYFLKKKSYLRRSD